MSKTPKDPFLTRSEAVAEWIVEHIVGTVGFVWFCLLLALFPLLVPRYMSAVQFASSGVLQLVLLPIILRHRSAAFATNRAGGRLSRRPRGGMRRGKSGRGSTRRSCWWRSVDCW